MFSTSCQGGNNKTFSFCRQVTKNFSGNLSKKKKKRTWDNLLILYAVL